MNNTPKISLELLILNDLLRTNVIDKNLYDRATQKLETINPETKVA